MGAITSEILSIVDKVNEDTIAKIHVGKSIISDMHIGVCSFRFYKEDDTVRVAHGTLNKDLLTSLGVIGDELGVDAQRGGISFNKRGDAYTRFFDLNKREWRAFRWDRLIDKF